MTDQTVHFGQGPASPPPDPDQPWLWIGDRWLLLATDDDPAGLDQPLPAP